MTKELATQYDPKTVEADIARLWAGAGAFDAEADDPRGAYCIVLPPPNVTAALHLGHALNGTLQDILIRHKRMQQHNTLWMPGTDHAGIATQTVVEKRILAEEGRRRTDFERAEFIERVQAWKDENGAKILDQLQRMGCSCDWRRTRFTMDEVCAAAVRENFFRLFADGLIYRGKRLVNWDPATQTVLADDEVEHEDVHGHFWYMRYPLVEPIEIPGGGTGAPPVRPTDVPSVERKHGRDGHETHGQDAHATHGRDARATLITYVTVATTRPETMLGDTAVAMNPSDPRAGHLVGKDIRLPLVGRIIPIIADEHVVLPDGESDDEKARFSTGFLKVTPAHDPDDYQIGLRHDLPLVNVMAPDGTISDRYGWEDAAGTDAEQFLGMDRFEARAAIVEWFRGEGLLEDVREYVHQVGHSYRSHVPIEPYLSDQWYIAVKQPVDRLAGAFGTGPIAGTDVPVNSLAGMALRPLLTGKVTFTPERYARTYHLWLENLRDWPISRQLWWGHQIPVWSQDLKLPDDVEAAPTDRGPDARTCAAIDEAIGGKFGRLLGGFPGVRHVLVCSAHPEDEGWIRTHVCLDRDDPGPVDLLERSGWVRDADVLDTWFSSALWPFSTLGWPEKTPEVDTFYPGDVLCTAREIITLWVSRMVMMGQYCLGDIPFADVFIHAMIQDGEGRKMSKSLGNGIDPLDIIDSHGADAMRFTLASMTTQTQDVRMPVEAMTLPDGRQCNTSPKFDLGRNFCNKLWNASRFVLMNIDRAPAWAQISPRAHLADAWILSRLNGCIREASGAIEQYRFNELADVLYHFTWDDFCDWYVEIAKARTGAGDQTPRAILAHCIDTILRLLHPIMPFITEAIWARLGEVAPIRGPGDEQAKDLLATARWPRADAAAIDPAAERDFDLMRALIRSVRDARRQHNVPPAATPDAALVAAGDQARVVLDNVELLRSQARLGQIAVDAPAGGPPPNSAAVAVGGVKLYVRDIVDVQAERARLTRQAETLAKGIRSIEGKLDNPGFLKKAPPEVVQRERERLAALTADLDAVRKSLDALQ